MGDMDERKAASGDWPFAEGRHEQVFTLRRILSGREAILNVHHDADDGAWQFMGWGMPDMADATMVSLETIVRLDPTVSTLADLPAGWRAWRSAPGEPWRRERQGRG